MLRTVLRCQAEESQHTSPLMDDLQAALDRCVLGFSGSFQMMVGRNNLPCHVTVPSTLLTSRCSGRKYRGLLKHDLTTSRQCKRLYFDAVSALVSPSAWVGGRCANIAGDGSSIDRTLEEARVPGLARERRQQHLDFHALVAGGWLTTSNPCDQS